MKGSADPVEPMEIKRAMKNEEPILVGLFEEADLPQFFKNQAPWVDEMKGLIAAMG